MSSASASSGTVDLLAIAAHRDDVELTCGGTLAKAVKAGHRVGIVDLTQGEMGTRGSAEVREKEAVEAARILGVAMRENLRLPDAAIVNDPPTREKLARVIRRLQPSIIIAPAREGRHPDHVASAQLVRDASFLAGLAKLAPDVPKHRPRKVLHCISFRQDFVRPSFVVDVSGVFELKMQAVRCYESQFQGLTQAGEVYPNGEPLEDVVRHHCAYYGTLIRKRYGEPFHTTEVMEVDDVLALGVSTF